MEEPLSFYTKELNKLSLESKEIVRKITFISVLRFGIFVLTAIGIYLYLNTNMFIPILILGVSSFVVLLKKHVIIKEKNKILNELIKINTLEIEVINGDDNKLENGEEFLNSRHYYSYDIDLFGEGSLFKFINRTSIKSAKKKLANIITSNNIEDIKEKQKMITELSERPKWRQKYSAIAKIKNIDVKTNNILKYKQENSFFVPKTFKNIPHIFSAITILLITLYATNNIPLGIVGLWFVIGMVITGRYLSKINTLYKLSNKGGEAFNQISLLLNEIEKSNFKSELLEKQKNKIETADKKASIILKDFSKVLDAFDQRNNMLFGFFANGLLLWDLRQSYRIEKWIKNYANNVENWFEVIAFFDVQNSLANYGFNYPNYTYPLITKNNKILEAENLGHPLLKTIGRVDNNLTITKNDFLIITGANMAGKSTFLRTISLSIVMANVGLPICATKSNYTPIKLITSMRTSDSLIDNKSYFFSELKRLKFIVDKVKNENYFIILDEILKGTNSEDKAIGSKKFVEQLVRTNATGIIATHDLSLCTIEKELKEVKNYYFDAEIKNNELYFDYQFKKGVCKNMNASFLLKKMEIIT
jgi:DNA mismatch repair ATPase MutS